MSIELANGEQWAVNFGAEDENAKGYSFAELEYVNGQLAPD